MRLLNATKQWFVQNIERTSAFITWFVVGGSAFYFLTLKYSLFHWRPLLSLGIFIALAVCFLITTRHDGALLRWRVPLFWAMYGLAQSTSRKGKYCDNACLESFFHSMKVETLQYEPIMNSETLRHHIVEYIGIVTCSNRFTHPVKR